MRWIRLCFCFALPLLWCILIHGLGWIPLAPLGRIPLSLPLVKVQPRMEDARAGRVVLMLPGKLGLGVLETSGAWYRACLSLVLLEGRGRQDTYTSLPTVIW